MGTTDEQHKTTKPGEEGKSLMFKGNVVAHAWINNRGELRLHSFTSLLCRKLTRVQDDFFHQSLKVTLIQELAPLCDIPNKAKAGGSFPPGLRNLTRKKGFSRISGE
jgi:hypothetical protein